MDAQKEDAVLRRPKLTIEQQVEHLKKRVLNLNCVPKSRLSRS